MTSDAQLGPDVGLSGLRVLPDRGVQVAEYAPGTVFGPRTLTDHEWVWLLQGSARWRCGRTELTLTPGTLLLVRAGQRDEFVWDPVATSRHAYVHFTVAAGDPAPGIAVPPEADWPATRDTDATPVLGGLCRYLVDLAGDPRPMATTRTTQLLSLLLDLFVLGPLPRRPRLSAHAAELVEQVRRRWWADGMRIVEVGELARAVGLSTGHVFRLFSAEFGTPPATALELVRLARAATLLQRSNSSLTEIADQTGFANAYHLSRRFRSAYGRPPGAFRDAVPRPDPSAPLDAAGLAPLGRLLLDAPPISR